MSKHILLINDIAGYGKVGMAAMMPILSYMGHPTYSLPTALVSNTLNYGKFHIQDTTNFIQGTLPIWKELGFHYDAICTGLMFSEKQVDLVSQYCKEQREHGTIIFVDPVMGDGGQLYNGIAPDHITMMRKMVKVADLVFPNYTEACYLTDTPFSSKGITWAEAQRMLDYLISIGTKSAVITSCPVNGENGVAGYNHTTNEYFYLTYEEIPGLFHGTGDIFSAILMGHLMHGEPLKAATRMAMDALSRLLESNKDLEDKTRGIPIENYLYLL